MCCHLGSAATGVSTFPAMKVLSWTAARAHGSGFIYLQGFSPCQPRSTTLLYNRGAFSDERDDAWPPRDHQRRRAAGGVHRRGLPLALRRRRHLPADVSRRAPTRPDRRTCTCASWRATVHASSRCSGRRRPAGSTGRPRAPPSRGSGRACGMPWTSGSPRARPRGSGTSSWRTARADEVEVDVVLTARPRPRALRRGADQRVLRQPVPRPHARADRARHRPRRPAEHARARPCRGCSLGSLGQGIGWATDTLQLVSGAARPGDPHTLSSARLPSTRLQHEHALVGAPGRPGPARRRASSTAPASTASTPLTTPRRPPPADERWARTAAGAAGGSQGRPRPRGGRPRRRRRAPPDRGSACPSSARRRPSPPRTSTPTRCAS